MTKIFKGRITGNNLRRNWHHAVPLGEEPPEFDTSVVEFKYNEEPFFGQLSQFEIRGRYQIGSVVNIEVSVFEEIK